MTSPAVGIFYDAVMWKLASYNASYLLVPNTTPLSERKAIKRRVSQEMPDADVKETPHGEEYYPAVPDLELDRLEKLILQISPKAALQIGPAESRGGGSKYRKPRYDDWLTVAPNTASQTDGG